MRFIENEGLFRAEVVDWGLTTKDDSNVVMCNFLFVIRGMYVGHNSGLEEVDEEGFVSWEGLEGDVYGVRGSQCLVNKDGTINKYGPATLAKVFKWDGSLNSIVNSDYPPYQLCQVKVVMESYTDAEDNARSFASVKSIYPYDRAFDAPKARSNVEDATDLDALYGGEMSAIVADLES